MNTISDSLKVIAGFLTPIIAILAVIIAYQQYRVQKYRVRMDLFDRRLKVYTAIKNFMQHVRQNGDVNHNQIFELIDQTSESKFLFNGEIRNHIEKLRDLALDLQEVNTELSNNNLPIGEERTRLAKERTKYFKELREQYNKTDTLFMKYLKLFY